MPEPSPFAFSQIAKMGNAESGYGQQLQQAMAPGFAPMQGPDNPRLPGEEELQNALAGIRDFQARLSMANEASSVPSPPQEMTIKTNPKTGQQDVTVKTTKENFENTTRSAMKWHEALGGMQQELSRMDQELAAKEQAIRNQPPWVQLATALSANLAQAKDMPGWVQGLGRTAAQLNPQAEEVRAQRMQIMGQQAQLAEKAAALEVGQQREARLMSYEEKTLGMEQKRLDRQITQDKLKGEQSVEEKWDDRATKGFFDAASYAKELKAANPDIKDEEIKALVVGKQALAAQADTLREKLGDAKFKEFEKEQNLKFKNDVKMAGIDHKNKIEELMLKNKGSINPKTGKAFTQFELKEIAEIETAAQLVTNLENDLTERPDLFGPMPQTRAKTWVKSFFDERVSQIRADYDHALPIMVGLLREGTRGYAQNQREWVESKVPKTTDTPERLRGKLAFLRGFLDARQKGLDAVFVAENMARDKQMQGQSPYPAPAASHRQETDIWTPERVKAEREKQRAGR